MAQNPAMIQPLLQQLAASNPALAQAFAQNPDALLQLLANENGEFPGGQGEDGENLPPGTHIVNVTEEERAAIERVSVSAISSHFYES
jgi:UV excision repair protein RAD23